MEDPSQAIKFTGYIGRLFARLSELAVAFQYTYSNIPVYMDYPMAYKNKELELYSLLQFALDNFNLPIFEFRQAVLNLNLTQPTAVEPNIVYLYMIAAKYQNEEMTKITEPKVITELLNYIRQYPIPGEVSMDNLEDGFDRWYNQLLELHDQEMTVFDRIRQQSADLNKYYQDYPAEIDDRRTVFSGNVSYLDSAMNPDTAFKFYINQHVNPYVILIRYGDRFRIYSNGDEQSNYYQQLRKIKGDANSIRLVFAPKDGKDINQNNISLVSIDIQSSRIYININVKQITTQEVIDQLKKLGLKITDLIVERLAVKIQLYAGPVQQETFLHHLLLAKYSDRDYYNQFMYIEEATKSVAIKNRINIYYRFPPKEYYSNIFPGYPDNLVAGVEIRPSIMDSGNIKEGEYILELSINKTDSMESVEAFIAVLKTLMEGYIKNKDYLQKLYTEYDILRVVKESQNVSRNTALRKIGFPTEYSRKCAPVKRLPYIIPEEELTQYINTPIDVKYGASSRRDYYTHLHNGKKYYIGCKDDEYPFIGAIKIGYPCCFNKMPRNKNVFSQPEEDLEKRSNYVAKSSQKILSVNKRADLPSSLTNILKAVVGSDGTKAGSVTNTIGTYSGSNNFIHAVIMAFGGNINNIDDNSRFSEIHSQHNDDPDGYANDLRQQLAEIYQPELVKQELWDLSNRDIHDMILNTELSFGSSFYRLLEEYFDINIYIFETTEGQSYLINPRNKYYHAQIYRERPCVLLYRLAGDHYQYISIGTRSLFNADVSERIYSIAKNSHISINVGTYVVNNNMINMAYPQDDVAEISALGYDIDVQYIDAAGKLRAVTTRQGPAFILLQPTQPLSLPSLAPGSQLPVVDQLPDSIGKPVGYSASGYYYDRWFIPAVVTNSDELPEMPEPNFVIDPVNSGTGLIELRRGLENTRNFILQILVWLYNLYLAEGGDAQQFMENEFDAISDTKYQFRDIWKQYTFPKVNYQQAKRWLAGTGMIVDDKIIVTSQVMYDGIVYFMQKYVNYNQPVLPERLYLLYDDVSMYPKVVNELVFLDLMQFDHWVSANAVNQNIIYHVAQWNLINPYMLYTPERIVIVQNVMTNNRNAAINVAKHYRETGQNTGYETSRIVQQMSGYQVIHLDDDGSIPESEHFTQDTAYIIQDHSSQRFAAILGSIDL